jgi:NADPH:quinone reductase
MKTTAIRMESTGSPDVMTVTTQEVGVPGPGDIRVRHEAVGLNYIDTYHRSGLYPVPLPSGLGLEAAGVVEAVGEGVTTLQPGDRVAYCWGPIGAYAGARVMPAAQVVKLPEGIDPRTAAALMLKGCTAEYLIRRIGQVQPGDWVLFPAAAGGVGLIAGQWLKAIGAHAIGVVSTQAKADLAKANGYGHVLVGYDGIADHVRALTGGRGVDVAIDGVGKDTWEASLASLRSRGMMISFGNASGPVPPFDIGTLAAKGGLFLTRPSLFHYYADPAERADGCAALFARVLAGDIKISIDQTYPLADAAQAHRDLEARRTTGSTLLLP